MSRLTDELRLLETERDDAVRVGEECARTVVKLEEMVSRGVESAGEQATRLAGLPHANAFKPAAGSTFTTTAAAAPQVRLLEALALNKVSEGDDDGARRVLQVGRDAGTSC